MSSVTNSQGLHTLATIIKRWVKPNRNRNSSSSLEHRLEAATSRLEDIAIAGAATGPVKKEVADSVSAAASVAPPPPPPVKEDPKSVTTYDEIIVQAKLQPFLTLSESIGGPVWEQASTRKI